jgi:hypothetical protein
MKNYEIEVLIKTLQNHLYTSDEMWKDRVSHAEIVGYLQGTVKGIIGHLETKLKK